MKYNEMKQAVKLLSKEWNLGKKEAWVDNDICAWIYLFDVLQESEKIIKYKDGSKLIGFCGYSKECSNKHKLSKKFYGFVKNRLYKSKSIKNLKAFKEYENNYNYIPEELKNHFDGEVSILIIVTDESCNYKFYESLGCKKVYETIVENKEIEQLGNGYTEKAFIYEKKL